MILLTLHPNYFKNEGFGTLMSHYATMYSLYKDTGITPCIVNIDFAQKHTTSAMDFFNQFNEPIIYHHKAFLGFDKIFKIMEEDEAKKIPWEIKDFRSLSYNQIASSILNYIKTNVVCHWTLNANLYYKYIQEICHTLFLFQKDIIDRSQALLPNTSKNIVGICVRNEYKKLDTPHVKLSMKFYENAMEQFDTKTTKYLIFSDDIEECRINFRHLQETYDIDYTAAMPSAIGMCTMSLCDHNICANSSFSYWASLLNKNLNKRVVCSTKFIDETIDPILANKLNYKWYPSEWEAVDVA